MPFPDPSHPFYSSCAICSSPTAHTRFTTPVCQSQWTSSKCHLPPNHLFDSPPSPPPLRRRVVADSSAQGAALFGASRARIEAGTVARLSGDGSALHVEACARACALEGEGRGEAAELENGLTLDSSSVASRERFALAASFDRHCRVRAGFEHMLFREDR
eukprot:4743414-Pleurochrysis_carterae.AAC.3